MDHSEAMSVVAFDEVPCWSTKTAKKQDEEPTKKSDSEGAQKEPKTAKKQDEEVLCCSYETCCTCGQEGLRREDAAAECRICGHLACTNWCILWRDRLGVLCRCCLGAQFDSIDGFCQGPDAVLSMERPEVAMKSETAAKTAEMENDLEEDPRQIASKTAEMESDLWKERLRVREIAETTAEIAEKTAEMKRTAQNLRETDRRAHKAEDPKPKRIHSEPVKPSPTVLFWPPAEVLPGESCNDHENGLVEKDEGQLDAATKAESQASPRNGT